MKRAVRFWDRAETRVSALASASGSRPHARALRFRPRHESLPLRLGLTLLAGLHFCPRAGRAHPRANRCPHAPDARGLEDPDRVCLRGRYLDRSENRRHRRCNSSSPRGPEHIPALFARWHPARLQRQLRWQHRCLRHARGRRRTAPHHAPRRERPPARLVSRRQVADFLVPHDELHGARVPAFQGLRPGRPAGKVTGGLRRVRRDFAGWPNTRFHSDHDRFLDVETLPRRHGGGHLAVRPGQEDGRKRNAQRRQRHAADVARQYALFSLGPRRARARQHLGLRHANQTDPPGDALRGIRRAFPEHRAGRHRL